jgi:hypothetical protein
MPQYLFDPADPKRVTEYFTGDFIPPGHVVTGSEDSFELMANRIKAVLHRAISALEAKVKTGDLKAFDLRTMVDVAKYLEERSKEEAAEAARMGPEKLKMIRKAHRNRQYRARRKVRESIARNGDQGTPGTQTVGETSQARPDNDLHGTKP